MTQINDNWDIVEILAKENKLEYNILKACEELTELQELLLKYLNKTPEKRPSLDDVAKEAADVMLRVGIMAQAFGIETECGEATEAKLAKLVKYYQEGKYKGGI